MHFAIIQDTERSENPPFAAHGKTLHEVAEKICMHMHLAYDMPAHIVTLEGAACWYSNVVEDGEEGYEDGASYDNVFWWDTSKM